MPKLTCIQYAVEEHWYLITVTEKSKCWAIGGVLPLSNTSTRNWLVSWLVCQPTWNIHLDSSTYPEEHTVTWQNTYLTSLTTYLPQWRWHRLMPRTALTISIMNDGRDPTRQVTDKLSFNPIMQQRCLTRDRYCHIELLLQNTPEDDTPHTHTGVASLSFMWVGSVPTLYVWLQESGGQAIGPRWSWATPSW